MIAPQETWRRMSDGHDRGLALACALLLCAGLVLSLAASPAAAEQLQLDNAFQLSFRHAGFAVLASVVLIAASQADPRTVRRIALGVFIASLIALVVVSFAGIERKGARRWLELGAVSLQPSEFAKPSLIILVAWMLSEQMKHSRFPGLVVAAGLFALFAALVAPQPDIGQTILTGLCVLALLPLARVPFRWLAMGLAIAAVGAVAAYASFSHVRDRVNAFASVEIEANSQVGLSLSALSNGGLFGQGPGEGVKKMQLPDAHADFVFAVAGEELGLIGVMGLLGLYVTIAWIGLMRASRLVDPFAQLAATGLILLFSAQAAIHVAVNISLVPAKGMTLPLVSYGGSSLLASALTLGLALALVRTRPGAFLHDRTSA